MLAALRISMVAQRQQQRLYNTNFLFLLRHRKNSLRTPMEGNKICLLKWCYSVTAFRKLFIFSVPLYTSLVTHNLIFF